MQTLARVAKNLWEKAAASPRDGVSQSASESGRRSAELQFFRRNAARMREFNTEDGHLPAGCKRILAACSWMIPKQMLSPALCLADRLVV